MLLGGVLVVVELFPHSKTDSVASSVRSIVSSRHELMRYMSGKKI